MAVVAMVLLTSRDAQAQQGGLLLQLDTEYERTRAPGQVQGLRDTVTAGLSIDADGSTGHGPLGFSAFLDAHFGAGLQGGFAYRAALLPVGFAVHDRRHIVKLGVTSGFMLQGVTGHQPPGVLAPLRVSLIIRAGDHLLLNAWGTSEFSLRSNRQGDADHALFGDEMRAGLVLRIGRGGKRDEGRQQVLYGSGYFLGALYSERLGTEFWGLTIGHGMDMRGG